MNPNPQNRYSRNYLLKVWQDIKIGAAITLLLWLLAILTGKAQNCKAVKKTVDKFNGSVGYNVLAAGPVLQAGNPNAVSYVILSKGIVGKDTIYAVSLSVKSPAIPDITARKGVIFLFDDQSRIEKSEQEIKITFSGNTTSLSTQTMLDSAEFALLTQKTLTDVRLGITDSTIHPKLAKSINEMGSCLIKTW